MKLAIVFPGIGYHCDKPLLYYSKKIAAQCGYKIIEVNYKHFPKNVKGSKEGMQKAFEIGLAQTEDILEGIDFTQYSDLLFLSKSIGTAICAAYAAKHCLHPKNIFYTPVEESFLFLSEPGIVFHGTNDPWARTEVVEQECQKKSLPLIKIESANHSLETGDITKDLKNLGEIMKETETYITEANDTQKQKRKYFFFDIDGTLIPVAGARRIPKNTSQAIEQLKAKGHFCAIATGRSHCLAEPQRKDLGFDHMISDGGNGVTIDGKLLGIDPLDKELCVQLAKECDELGFPWALSMEDKKERLTKYQSFIDRADNPYQSSTLVEDLHIENLPQVLKMFIAFDPGEEEKLPTLSKLPWVRYTDEFIFVEPMNKEVGIRKVMEYFHASDEDIVVFGDGKNDLSMFLPEWTCIAMGNAVPELKERASFITKNSADDGVVYALKHFGWID